MLVGRNFLIGSGLLITLIKFLLGHRSLGSLFDVKSKSTVSQQVKSVTRSPIELFWTAKKKGDCTWAWKRGGQQMGLLCDNALLSIG